MDTQEFTQFMQRYPECNGIQQYLYHSRTNDTTSHYYVLDNNFLTDLASLARKETSEFKRLMNHYKNDVFIIPQMVMEESIRNLPNQQAVDGMYLDFYREMHGLGIPVFLESLEHNYRLFAVGFNSAAIALNQYKELASKLLSHVRILDALRNVSTIKDIDNAYRLETRDAGERFIFLYASAMLMDKVFKVTILSNEKKGVYNVWSTYTRNMDLLAFLKVRGPEDYGEKLKPVSYNGMLLDFLREQLILSEQQMKDFLKKARTNDAIYKNKIFYSRTNPHIVEEREIQNDEFFEFVQNQQQYRIAF